MIEIVEAYRKTFLGTKFGKDVLADILRACHFGCTLDPDDKVVVAEHNVGMVILAKLGIFSKGTEEQVIAALAAVMPPQE